MDGWMHGWLSQLLGFCIEADKNRPGPRPRVKEPDCCERFFTVCKSSMSDSLAARSCFWSTFIKKRHWTFAIVAVLFSSQLAAHSGFFFFSFFTVIFSRPSEDSTPLVIGQQISMILRGRRVCASSVRLCVQLVSRRNLSKPFKNYNLEATKKK